VILSSSFTARTVLVDVTLAAGGFLPGVLQVGIDDSSLELQSKLDEVCTQLIVVWGEAQDNSTAFQMHLWATFASQYVLEKFCLTWEASDWVLGDSVFPIPLGHHFWAHVH
jgi:hypothetical protein